MEVLGADSCHIDLEFDMLPEEPDIVNLQEFPSNEVMVTIDSNDETLIGTELIVTFLARMPNSQC